MVHSLANYAMRIVHLDGRPINWHNPPNPQTRVAWTKKTIWGERITGSFRTICHWDHLNRLAYRRWGVGINFIQGCYNTDVSASEGTHDYDAVGDAWIPGVDPWTQQRFFRRNGAGGWIRKPPMFTWHYHFFTLPHREGSNVSDDFRSHGFKVGIYVDGGYSTRGGLITSSQIQDYYNEAYGLSGMHTPGSDNTWFPENKASTIFNLHKFVQKRMAERRN